VYVLYYRRKLSICHLWKSTVNTKNLTHQLCLIQRMNLCCGLSQFSRFKTITKRSDRLSVGSSRWTIHSFYCYRTLPWAMASSSNQDAGMLSPDQTNYYPISEFGWHPILKISYPKIKQFYKKKLYFQLFYNFLNLLPYRWACIFYRQTIFSHWLQ